MGCYNIKRGIILIVIYIIVFSVIGNIAYSIEGKSGNYTLSIEESVGVDFEDEKEEQNTAKILGIIIFLVIFFLLILRIRKLKRGKK